MSDNLKKVEEVKKIIRSLLIVYPDALGVKMKDFLRDFKAMENYAVPYKEFGYGNPEDFFRDIPDVVRMSWDGGELILRGVADEATAHIKKYVNKQKVTQSQKKKRFRPSRPDRTDLNRNTGQYGRSARYDGNRNTGQYMYSKPPSNYRHIPPRHLQQQSQQRAQEPTVPALLRGKIRDLLILYPGGLLGSNFDVAFQRRYHSQLNYMELGFRSLKDFLHAMEDILTIEQMQSGGFKIHSKMGQKLSMRETQLPKSAPTSGQGSDSKNWREKSQPAPQPADQKQPISPRSEESDDESGINKSIRKNIQKVLESHPEGIWSGRFPDEYHWTTGRTLPYKQLGFHSVIEMMSTLSQYVSIERPGSGDWLLKDARMVNNTQPQARARAVSGHSTGSGGSAKEQYLSTAPKIAERYKEIMWQVVDYNGHMGMVLDDMAVAFKNLTGKRLPMETLGFTSIEDLMYALDDIIDLRYEGQGRLVAYALPNKYDKFKVKTVEAAKPQVKGFPYDAIGPGCCYSPMPLPYQSLQEGSFLEIFVSNIVDPQKFWLQLKGDRTTIALEDLMDRLEETYYGRNSDEYNMPDHMVKVGQICVAIFPEDENWHRVTITDIRDEEFVEVYYVDYGSTSCVSRNSLKLLKSRYLKLPAQAMMARLANITPAGGSWNKPSRDLFMRLVANKPLLALVTDISEDGIISVCLCDTSGEEDVHVNDRLVDEKYASLHLDKEMDEQANMSTHTPAKVMYGPEGGETEEGELQLDTEPYDSQAEDAPPTPRYAKFVDLPPKYYGHVINHCDKAYLVGGEISAFLWQKDLLRTMLRQRKVNVPKVIVSQQEFPQLFTELQQLEVKGCFENGELRSHINLYELSSVLEILKLFGHQSGELKTAIQRQIDTFNPEHRYWKGYDDMEEENEEEEEMEEEDNEEVSDSDEDDMCSEEDDTPLSLAQLEMALGALTFKRKRVLESIATNPDKCVELVDELQTVEQKLVEVKDMISKAKGEQKTSINTDDMTEEEKFIVDCIDEQYKASSKTEPHESTIQDPFNKTPARSVKTNPVAPTLKTQAAAGDTTARLPANPLTAGATGAVPQLPQNQMQILAQYRMMLQQMSMFSMQGQMPNMPGAPNPAAAMSGLPLVGGLAAGTTPGLPQASAMGVPGVQINNMFLHTTTSPPQPVVTDTPGVDPSIQGLSAFLGRGRGGPRPP